MTETLSSCSRRAPLGLLLALLLGCGAGPAAPPPAPAAPVVSLPAPGPAPQPEPQPAPQLSGARPLGLGQQLRDPEWFRADLWPGAKLVKEGRSAADAQGLFASQILLDLPPEIDIAACTAKLQEHVKPHVPNLTVDAAAPSPDGRQTLRGTTDTYAVAIVCGKVAGVTRAFVNYNWTSVPAAG